MTSVTTMESRARRAAEAVGLYAKKSRKRTWSPHDQGGFMLVEPSRNLCVAGQDYDLDAEDVLTYCRG